MIDSAKFVIEKTIQPALDLYKKAKTYNHVSSNELNILKTAADKAQNAKNVVQNFKKTGDLYSYLKVLIRSGEEELAIEFRKIGLVPFEDIISIRI